ncbi:hypothetical protein BCD95_002263 [Clostridium beijerinckii]|uniref:Uncharacterized protein n=1 Tax=Clostridium beijerinckii TaxID=1520 RepID=A0AAE5EXH8_CLOBE|nr:hypothetical protein [Clostridium beijerinckii]
MYIQEEMKYNTIISFNYINMKEGAVAKLT